MIDQCDRSIIMKLGQLKEINILINSRANRKNRGQPEILQKSMPKIVIVRGDNHIVYICFFHEFLIAKKELSHF